MVRHDDVFMGACGLLYRLMYFRMGGKMHHNIRWHEIGVGQWAPRQVMNERGNVGAPRIRARVNAVDGVAQCQASQCQVGADLAT